MTVSAMPVYVGSVQRSTEAFAEVRHKYTDAVYATVSQAGDALIDEAIQAAVDAQPQMSATPAHARRAALLHIADSLREKREEFAQALLAEVGKPISLCRGEVDRAVDTFTASAEEASRLFGELLPLDGSPRGDGFMGVTKRVPVGPCSFITPFNFPLNLAAHKIGPAIAAGCTWVLKPDHRTPVTSLMLGAILAETDLPPGSFSILPGGDDGRHRFSEDERLKLLSFTGSPAVGWKLKGAAGRKKVVLELGGNAACIVDEGVDVERAVKRLAYGAFYQAGQSCISVQRILVHESIYALVRTGVVELAKIIGRKRDPMDEFAIYGPVIDVAAADRIEAWLAEATAKGARVLTGAGRDGRWISPTVLEETPHDVRLSGQEVFGPVVTIEPFSRFDDALEIANASEWGLQAGVFTPRLDHAMRAFNSLEVAGVIINDIPSTRIDAMPYGGVKGSGAEREGPRYAIEDMTELRLMVLSHLG